MFRVDVARLVRGVVQLGINYSTFDVVVVKGVSIQLLVIIVLLLTSVQVVIKMAFNLSIRINC